MQKITLKKEPNIAPKLSAFEFQRFAVDAVKNLEYSAIFHEQGLGKTKIAIDLMLYWLQNKEIDTVLIVTKKGLVNNWMRELKVHTHMTPRILDQDKGNNYYVFNSPTRLILTHFEVVASEQERFKLYLKTRDVAIIIDESAKIKNPTANITQAFFSLSSSFKRRVIMTGTPIANRPYDIWSQIFFLDHGRSLGSDFADFKTNTDLSNDLLENIEKREEFEITIQSVFNRIRQFSVRETKDSGIYLFARKNN